MRIKTIYLRIHKELRKRAFCVGVLYVSETYLCMVIDLIISVSTAR